MSPCLPVRTRHLRRVVGVGLIGLAGGAFGPAAADAVPVSKTLDYTCTFPLLPPEPLRLEITSDIPDRVPLNTRTGSLAIAAKAQVSPGAVFGLRSVESSTIEGTAVAAASIRVPGSAEPLELDVDTVIEPTTVPASGGLTTTASGSTPSLTFGKVGTATIDVGGLVMTLTARLADGTKTGLDTFESECALQPGQDTTLATIAIGAAPTTGFTLAGSARLRTLTTGTVPITGTLNAPIAAGAFTGELALRPVRARLVALGFIPVVAQLAFVTSGQTTGSFTNGALTLTPKIRTKLSQVSLFGTIPLAGGTTCQTRSISTVELRSTQAFDPGKGGTVAGSFAISDLSGCGPLTGLLSPLTAGGGNALTLALTPTPAA